MKIIINTNKERIMKREWLLNKWYEKLIYIMGIFYIAIIVLGFLLDLFFILT